MAVGVFLVLLCVPSALSLKDNVTEGLPWPLNVSSEDWTWMSYVDGDPVSEDNATLYLDGFPIKKILHKTKMPDYTSGIVAILGEPVPDYTSGIVAILGEPGLMAIPIRARDRVIYEYIGIESLNFTEDGGRQVNLTHHNRIRVAYKRLHTSLGLLRSWWVTRLVPSIYCVVVLVALPLNIMALVIFVVKVKVQKPGVVYLLNLAVADVVFVTLLPFFIIYRFSGNNWLMGEAMCRLVAAAFHSNIHGSVLMMTSISVDRFLALVYPVRSLSWRTVRRAWLVCAANWTLSVASVAPIVLMPQTRHIAWARITTCYDIQDVEDLRRLYIYQYFPIYVSLLYFLPLIITTSCYIAIIRSLSAATIKGAHRRSRAVLLSVVVLCVFLVCFGPTYLILLLHYLHVAQEVTSALYIVCVVSLSVSSLSACVDPLIYYYSSSQWQQHVYTMLGCSRDGGPHHVTSHLTNHLTNHVTSHLTNHLTNHVTSLLTNNVTSHVTSHDTNHVTSLLTNNVTSHVTNHVTNHVTRYKAEQSLQSNKTETVRFI